MTELRFQKQLSNGPTWTFDPDPLNSPYIQILDLFPLFLFFELRNHPCANSFLIRPGNINFIKQQIEKSDN